MSEAFDNLGTVELETFNVPSKNETKLRVLHVLPHEGTHFSDSGMGSPTETFTNVPLFVLPEEGMQEKVDSVKNLDEIKRHPNIYFIFNQKHLLNNGVLQANVSTRKRAVISALAAQTETYKDLTVSTAERTEKNLRTSVAGAKIDVGTMKYQRRLYIKHDDVLIKLVTELSKTNDPVLQVLNQLDREYTGIIPKHELVEIAKSVLNGLHSKKIHEIYQEKVKTITQKDSPRILKLGKTAVR